MTTREASPPATADLLTAVERIRPVLEENAPRAEAGRRTPDESYQAMLDAGLFGMLAPEAFGGLELGLAEAMTVWEAVTRIDSAAAWNLVMNQALADFAAWLPEEGTRELFANGPTTLAGALSPPGAARRGASRAAGGSAAVCPMPAAAKTRPGSASPHSRWTAMS